METVLTWARLFTLAILMIVTGVYVVVVWRARSHLNKSTMALGLSVPLMLTGQMGALLSSHLGNAPPSFRPLLIIPPVLASCFILFRVIHHSADLEVARALLKAAEQYSTGDQQPTEPLDPGHPTEADLYPKEN